MTLEPHQSRGSQADLMALVRYWEWERAIEALLPRVIDEQRITIVLQPIFQLLPGMPICRGYEVLSRFPIASRIPVGLWFGTAQRLGLERELELAAVRASLDSLSRIPDHVFVSINASMSVVSDLLEEVPEEIGWRLVVDLPSTALHDESYPAVAEGILDLDLLRRAAVTDGCADGIRELHGESLVLFALAVRLNRN